MIIAMYTLSAISAPKMANPPRYHTKHDTGLRIAMGANGTGNVDLHHTDDKEVTNPSSEYNERMIKDMKNEDRRRGIRQGGGIGLITGGLGGGGAGAGAGAIIGAIAGSVVPGPGTAIGAAIGATIGGITGGLTAGGVGTGLGAAIAARFSRN